MDKVRSIRASANANSVDLWITSEISPWTYQDFVGMCEFYGKDKQYIINIFTPGGDPFAAFAIHDHVKANGISGTARIWGHAASAGVIVACSFDRIEIGENAYMMAHDAYGGSDQELLDSLNEKQVSLYKKRTGLSSSKIVSLMKEERWMDAKEAKANGFADTIIKEMAIAALYKAQYMEDQTKPEEVVEVPPVVETPTEEIADTEEVEQEIIVTVPQAVEAAIKGKIIAKVKVSAEMKRAVADLTKERNEVKAQLQEVTDEVTALREKLESAEARAVKAEAEVSASATQIAAITAEVEKLKAAPLATPEASPKATVVVTPGDGPTKTIDAGSRSDKKERMNELVNATLDKFHKRGKGAAQKS